MKSSLLARMFTLGTIAAMAAAFIACDASSDRIVERSALTDPSCDPSLCGNGSVDPGEECDPPNTASCVRSAQPWATTCS